MGNCIRRLTLPLNGRLVDASMKGHKFVCLDGDSKSKNTLLYTLERFIARDFGVYYSDIDGKSGMPYTELTGNVSVNFSKGAMKYSDSTLQVQGVVPDMHCVRYLYDGLVRSFILNDGVDSGSMGTDMSKYSSVLSEAKWRKLVGVFNRLIGHEMAMLDVGRRTLEFDIHDYNGWDAGLIEVAYVLLSESMLTPEGYSRILLLSEFGDFQADKIAQVIKAAGSLPGVDMVVYADDLGFEITDNGTSPLRISV